MGTPIQKLEGICAEIYSQWDKDMRSGKLLSALAGGTLNYRQDVTDVRAALERFATLEDTLKRARWALEAMINLHGPDPAGMALMALNDLDQALSPLMTREPLKAQAS